jgi:hypothetical protein
LRVYPVDFSIVLAFRETLGTSELQRIVFRFMRADIFRRAARERRIECSVSGFGGVVRRSLPSGRSGVEILDMGSLAFDAPVAGFLAEFRQTTENGHSPGEGHCIFLLCVHQDPAHRTLNLPEFHSIRSQSRDRFPGQQITVIEE